MSIAPTLSERIAAQFGLGTLAFRHFDSVVFENGEVLKLYAPRSLRAIGGSASERVLGGELYLLLRQHLKPLRKPSKKFENPQSPIFCPIANFPDLYRDGNATFTDRPIKDDFIGDIGKLLAALPSTERSVEVLFGEGIFDRPPNDRCVGAVAFLRSAVKLG